MGCGRGFLKTILVIVNVLFFLAGAAILGVGLWVRFDKNIAETAEAGGLKDFVKPLQAGSYVLIAFGALTFIIGFCGCCGALRDSKCLIGIYIAFVVAILGAEIGGGVYAYINKDKLINEAKKLAMDFIQNTYDNDETKAADLGFNSLMQTFKCCGVNGAQDFEKSLMRKNNASRVVPMACCKKDGDKKDCLNEVKNPPKKYDNLNGKGCADKLKELFDKYSIILLGVGAGVAGFELLVVAMAICFCCSIDKDE